MNAEQFFIENIEKKTRQLQSIHFDVLHAFLNAGIEQGGITRDLKLSNDFGQCILPSEVFSTLQKNIDGFSKEVGIVCMQDLIAAGFLFVVRDNPNKEIALAVTKLGIRCLIYSGKVG